MAELQAARQAGINNDFSGLTGPQLATEIEFRVLDGSVTERAVSAILDQLERRGGSEPELVKGVCLALSTLGHRAAGAIDRFVAWLDANEAALGQENESRAIYAVTALTQNAPPTSHPVHRLPLDGEAHPFGTGLSGERLAAASDLPAAAGEIARRQREELGEMAASIPLYDTSSLTPGDMVSVVRFQGPWMVKELGWIAEQRERGGVTVIVQGLQDSALRRFDSNGRAGTGDFPMRLVSKLEIPVQLRGLSEELARKPESK